MAVRFYDDALVKKLEAWIKNPNLKILKPDETTRFFERELDENNDKPLTLPLISISRDKNIEILNLQKQAKTFDGFCAERSSKMTVPINVVPIQIGYQIDIYTKGMAEADEYLRNFIFNFINYPKLTVEIPYNSVHITHQSNIHLESSVSDNSDIKEHLFPDQFVRFTLKIYIDDAYLFSLPVNEIPQIESIDMVVQDRYTNEIVDESKIRGK